MPLPVLEAHLDQIPPLVAEESLQSVERIAFGVGAMKEDDRTALLRQWRRDLDIRAERPRDRASMRRMAAASGIGMTVVPAKDSNGQRIPRKGRAGPRNRRDRP